MLRNVAVTLHSVKHIHSVMLPFICYRASFTIVVCRRRRRSNLHGTRFGFFFLCFMLIS